jgi:capsular polysaccharide export protein
VELIWLEDGFIRSAGLGAAFRAGASFAIDTRGPYYDPARESDLEHLLATVDFPPALLARAAALREAIVARGVTKYNLGGEVPVVPAAPGRRRVLVPGQVEDDASVALGGGAIRTNLGLLRPARAAEPDAFLIYKPHPDIEAGYRRGRIAAPDLAGIADQVIERAPMAAVLGRVDAVHTLTSLTGFEALLRGLPVTCWGAPFYAGWGLTEDRLAVPRRTRRLTLDELVAGSLILYPRCLDPLTGLPCPPEVLLDRMGRPELFPPGRRARLRAVEGWIGRTIARWRGLR